MVFANAIYSWGLLGLLLPIAIHLWSRKKVKTIKVGSIKLLLASEPKQTSSIKINELWLLLLRLLIVLLLVFILVEPSISRAAKSSTINYVIEPSLINDERMRSYLDTIPKESVHVLETGFPEMDAYVFREPSATPAYWQLAQQMHKIAADSIVVFSKGLSKGLKGTKPKISANTRWIVIESNEKTEIPVTVTQKESSLEVLFAHNDANNLSFKKNQISFDNELIEINSKGDSILLNSNNREDWMKLKKDNPIQIVIVSNDSLKDQIRYFQAAYSGISKFLNRPVEIEILESLDNIDLNDIDIVVSFNHRIEVNNETKYLVYLPNEYTTQLIENGVTKNEFHLTKLLNSENIVNERLPEKLLSILNLNKDLEVVINSVDERVVTEKELQPIIDKGETVQVKAGIVKLTPWLWLLLILVVLVERILSKLRKQ